MKNVFVDDSYLTATANAIRAKNNSTDTYKPSEFANAIASISGGGADGVGIQSVVQTTTSAEDGGTNVITVTKTDGTTSTFQVKNGSKGSDGVPGADGKDGADGQPGADGKSAYQYAKDGGYTGTEEEFAAKMAEEMPTVLPNPNALTFTGAVTGSYDGSEAKTINIPSGGGGSAFSPQLIAKLVADGTTTSISQDIDVAYPAIYTVSIIGKAIADAENAGQYLFAKFGASDMYANALDVRAIQTVNNNFSQQFVAVTFALDSEKCFHVIGKAENNASNTSNWMTTIDGSKILTNAIFFYSSSSKIIPAGFTCSVWRWA